VFAQNPDPDISGSNLDWLSLNSIIFPNSSRAYSHIFKNIYV